MSTSLISCGTLFILTKYLKLNNRLHLASSMDAAASFFFLILIGRPFGRGIHRKGGLVISKLKVLRDLYNMHELIKHATRLFLQ